MRRKYSTTIDDFMAFEEFLEMRSRKEKDKDKKKEPPPKGPGLTFAEGMIVAYLAQFVVGPLYKVALVHMGIQ